MKQVALKDALAQTTQYDRDLLEKIITRPSSVCSISLGYGEHRALETSYPPDRSSLSRLRNLGLIGFNNGRWSYIAGPISNFFAFRIINNFE